MGDDRGPARLPVAELCRRCREETGRYRRGEPSDDSYCFDMIRRAVSEKDEDCWREMYSIYRELVVGWCRRAGTGGDTGVEDLVADTWVKFLRNYTPQKLADAAGATSVLRYLQTCAFSVAVDAARGQNAAVSLDESFAERVDPEPTAAEIVADGASYAALWEVVDRHLRTEQERQLIFLRFELDLRPADIQARRPDLFPSVIDVYRVWRNVADRLKRSGELRRWLEQDSL